MPSRRITKPQFSVSGVCVVVLGVLGTGLVYNSEEHKLIVNRGVSRVDQRSAQLPPGTYFLDGSQDAARLGYLNAKRFAVGFESNNQSEYSDQRKKVQDNSYWDGYGQLEYNKNIYIPDPTELSGRVLVVPAFTHGGDAGGFVFGDLVSLYGDYRRTVHCDDSGRCYLTNRDAPQYVFSPTTRGGGTTYFEYGEDCFLLDCGWRPLPMPTSTYLNYVASGLVPPFGGWGNQVANTAYPSEELDAGWWGDEMIRIANVNDWHFASAAIAWYVGMHRLALLYVERARSNPVYWNHALHYEASALHSLTDLFAFGHVVTNRDRTSYGIMKSEGLSEDPSYKWMENVLVMGGGGRASDGRLEIGAALPTIQDLPTARDDFMESDRDFWLAYANREREYHNQFNNSGATVRNLKRQEFFILGDAHLRTMSRASADIIAEAVRASVQSLFDAYESTAPLAEIGGPGSDYFNALLNVPVYVTSHPERIFDGRWTRYARVVDAITGAGIVPESAGSCEMAYVDGNPDSGPPGSQGPCTAFAPAPRGALIVEELVSANGVLSKGDRLALDAMGNQNNTFDVGDFLAWVRATGATPDNLDGAVVPRGRAR